MSTSIPNKEINRGGFLPILSPHDERSNVENNVGMKPEKTMQVFEDGKKEYDPLFRKSLDKKTGISEEVIIFSWDLRNAGILRSQTVN